MVVDMVEGNDSVHYQFNIQKILEDVTNFLASVIFHLYCEVTCFLLKYDNKFFCTS